MTGHAHVGRRCRFALGLGVLGWVLAMGLSSASSPEEAAGGPGSAFKDPLLDTLVGHWNVSREMTGRQVRNTLDVEWVLLHRFLQLHYRDAAAPPQYEAIVLIGYDTGGQGYVIHWCDSFGGESSLTGRGKRSGDAIEFVFDGPAPFYNTFTRDPATGRWSFLLQNGGKDGRRVFFAKDNLSR